MNLIYSDDPIIACSTGGLTNTAIAIIRISGNELHNTLNPFFSIDFNSLKPRYAHFCKIVESGKVVDEIVLTYFKGPNSYNGEDTFELSVHGNILNIKRIISLFTENTNIRTAHPGEFSYRALQNNKLTLNQVEGLDLLLNANSIFALDQGFSLLSGALQKDFKLLYDLFLEHKSTLELGFDFLEDIGEDQFNEKLRVSFNNLKRHIAKLYTHVQNSDNNLLNPEIAIIGLPNAGKSSLFNSFLDDERAIVSDIAGTTRDYISEKVKINDVIFTLIDTAGIRDTSDVIEGRGVEKALQLLSTSFFKLLLVNPFDDNSSYYEKLRGINFDLIAFSHKDQAGFSSAVINFTNKYSYLAAGPIEPSRSGPIEPSKSGPIEPTKSGPIEPSKSGPIEPIKSGPIEPIKFGPIEPSKSGPIEPIKSGPIEPTKSGPIEPLAFNLLGDFNAQKVELFDQVTAKYLKLLKFDPIMVNRQSDNIQSIYNNFSNYSSVFDSNFHDISIVASELNIVGHCISELIGIISPDDVLHNIFDNFCIGK
jgi:tRNA modification GTPase